MPKRIIIIEGIIGWDVIPEDIRGKLDTFDGADIEIEISSPGGFVDDGIVIFNLINNYKGHVTTHLMGFAASMASYIALAGDLITAESNAIFMIHNVSGIAWGDSREMEKESKILEGLTSLLSRAYALKSGKTIAEIRDLMNDETYFFGPDMKEAGFVDEIIPLDKANDPKMTKNQAVALAKTSVAGCIAKMKKFESKENFERAAALLNIGWKNENTSGNGIGSPEQRSATNAGNNKEEVAVMFKNLQAVFDENPHCKAEVDNLVKESFDKGVLAGKEEVQARAESAKAILLSDYSDGIKAIALKVITGERSITALEDALTFMDCKEESDKEKKAKGETEEQEETIGNQNSLSDDGMIRNDSDLKAATDRVNP